MRTKSPIDPQRQAPQPQTHSDSDFQGSANEGWSIRDVLLALQEAEARYPKFFDDHGHLLSGADPMSSSEMEAALRACPLDLPVVAGMLSSLVFSARALESSSGSFRTPRSFVQLQSPGLRLS